MSRALATHVAMGEAAEFLIDQWDKAVEGALISLAPRQQQARDFSGR